MAGTTNDRPDGQLAWCFSDCLEECETRGTCKSREAAVLCTAGRGLLVIRIATTKAEVEHQQSVGLTLTNALEVTSREISLIYFQRFQETILQRLRITQDPATLSDDDRVDLVWAYLDIVSG